MEVFFFGKETCSPQGRRVISSRAQREQFLGLTRQVRKRPEYGFGEYGFQHRALFALRRELGECLSAYYLTMCAKTSSPSLTLNSPSLPQNSVSSLNFRNSTLKHTCFWQRSLTAKQLLYGAKGRKTANTHSESACGWALIGWALVSGTRSRVGVFARTTPETMVMRKPAHHP